MSDQHWSQMMLPRDRIEQLENVNRELREENERVRQANLHTMDVFEDMKAAKEQAEAREAELLTICQAVQRDLLLRAEPDWDGSEQQVVNLSAGFWEELNRVIGKYDDTACKSFDAMILRKQAEAVEDIRKDLLSDLPDHPVSRQVAARLELRVNSLREKAEKAGGGQ